MKNTPTLSFCNSCICSHLELSAADPCQIHQHHPGVEAGGAVKRVTGEAAVPANLGDLVLRGHGSQLGGVELPQELPDVIDGPQEEHISVHVKQGIHVL